MARARRQPARAQRAAQSTSKSTKSTGTSAQSGEFVCPECGRTFTRAAALGAHRRRAHGIAGQSAQARRKRSATGRGATRRPSEPVRRAAKPAASSDGVDRDALLAALFPAGIPAKEDVIRALAEWLDDAERLAEMR